jgi:hypothetical protein
MSLTLAFDNVVRAGRGDLAPFNGRAPGFLGRAPRNPDPVPMLDWPADLFANVDLVVSPDLVASGATKTEAMRRALPAKQKFAPPSHPRHRVASPGAFAPSPMFPGAFARSPMSPGLSAPSRRFPGEFAPLSISTGRPAVARVLGQC